MKWIGALLLAMTLSSTSYAVPAEAGVAISLPDSPLTGVRLGMSLEELMRTRPAAKAGFFGKAVDAKKKEQTLFEKLAGSGTSATYHVRKGELVAVDYSVALAADSASQGVPKKLAKHLRTAYGKETHRYVTKERGKKDYQAACLQWDSEKAIVVLQNVPKGEVGGASGNGMVLVRFTLPSFETGVAPFKQRRQYPGAKREKELFRDVDDGAEGDKQ